MADAIRVSGTLTGTDKTLSMETGKLAQQSQGAVVASLGRTTVLATANAAKDVRPGTDFFPLTIDVEERAYAAGKIPGSFFRREGRPSDAAVLDCRLIDRPLRPSFPKGFRNETQVVITVQGADQVNPYDVVAINAASASLMLTGLPFEGPIGGVRLAYSTDGEWIPYPTFEEQDDSTFQIVVAGREVNGEIAIMMVEAGGTTSTGTFSAAVTSQGMVVPLMTPFDRASGTAGTGMPTDSAPSSASSMLTVREAPRIFIPLRSAGTFTGLSEWIMPGP